MENNKTSFFYVLYSDKTRVFDQSERAYYPIYIIICENAIEQATILKKRQRSSQPDQLDLMHMTEARL